MAFNVNLQLDKYQHLFPETPPSEEIINCGLDKEDCVWKKQSEPAIITRDYVALETKRLRQGAFIVIKETLLWLPPNYYFFLQYGIAGGDAPQFRLKKLKQYYFKAWVRANKEAIGTYTIKNRQDGETTSVMSDILYELILGNNYHGQFGIQSKTNEDAYNPCWLALKSQWMNYPKWFKDIFYPDLASGKNIETQMRFESEERKVKNYLGETEIVKSRNLLATYYPSVYNAMDGKQNVLKCVLDEVNKWKLCSLYDTIINYSKFIMVGAERKGLFDIFSSPADVNGRWNDEALQLWDNSNPEDLDENGTTKSRIFAFHSDPLDGIQGLYDKYGDADRTQVYDKIMRNRKALPADKQLGEVRGFPLNKEEMFGSHQANTIWDNHKGIVERKMYVMSSIYKNEVTREPKYVWGNLEWEFGKKDIEPPIFKPNKENIFDINTGRFALTAYPNFSEPLINLQKPPKYVDSCLGVDPFNNRYGTKKKTTASNGSGICFKSRDLFNTDFVPHPNLFYSCRPHHQDIFFEDMLKAAIYMRAYVQYENRSDKLANYFEDRGYFDWLLPEIGQAANSNRKGDAPSGGAGNKFLSDGIYLINALTSEPIDDTKPNLLNHIWFEQLLAQIEEFDDKNTQKYDSVMALIQALVGSAKIASVKVRNGTKQASQMISYILS